MKWCEIEVFSIQGNFYLECDFETHFIIKCDMYFNQINEISTVTLYMGYVRVEPM